jgi:hypothetical protein
MLFLTRPLRGIAIGACALGLAVPAVRADEVPAAPLPATSLPATLLTVAPLPVAPVPIALATDTPLPLMKIEPDFPSDEENRAIAAGLDTAMAQAVLASLGAVAPQVLRHKARAADPFRARNPEPVEGDTGFALADLTSHSLGAPHALGVELTDTLDTSSFGTQLKLRHASGPVDVTLHVSGNKALHAADPMQLNYDGSAIVTVTRAFQLGMVARGDLGTFSALSTQANQIGGPVARLKLGKESDKPGAISLAAETGMAFPLDRASDAAADRFHARIKLDLKL